MRKHLLTGRFSCHGETMASIAARPAKNMHLTHVTRSTPGKEAQISSLLKLYKSKNLPLTNHVATYLNK